MSHSVATEQATIPVLVYSDDSRVRAEVITGVGRRAAADLPLLEWTEVATPEAVVAQVKENSFAALVLDAEAPKAGGISVARTLKTELYECPPVLIIIARQQDGWLATWAQADGIVSHPVDPFEIQEALAGLLRGGQ